MGRPGLTRHRKFARLARLLESEALALGHLELLWGVAYENGDDLLGDAADVEYLARWKGEAGRLADALVESGFLDESDDRLRVHDLWDHAPDYVRKRRAREAERRVKGADLRAEPERRPEGDRTATGQRRPNGGPLAPAPAPAPVTEALRLTPQPDAPSPSAKDERKANPRHAPLRAKLGAVFLEAKGAKYLWQGPKDAEALNALLPLGTDDEIEQRWRFGLEGTGWLACATVAQLRQKWNDLAPRRTRPQLSRAGTARAESPLWRRVVEAHDALPPEERWNAIHEASGIDDGSGGLVVLVGGPERAAGLTAMGRATWLGKLAGGVPVRIEAGGAP